MKLDRLKSAIAEAERFLAVAKRARIRMSMDGTIIEITGSKETAAAKRASMDLSRALSELRR